MLLDAEMDKLLHDREEWIEALPYVFDDNLGWPEVRDYVLRLDAALPWMVAEIQRLRKRIADFEYDPRDLPLVTAEEKLADEDVCGLCGKPGADKFAHSVHWPGERKSDGLLVHKECEDKECGRAHAVLSDDEREAFLRGL